MSTRIKICGITRPQDAQTAAQLGADAIGLVFYPKSPRAIDIATAQTIVRATPAFVSITALFVNESPAAIQHCLQHLPIDILQFHGDEDAAFCRQFNRPYLKAIRVKQAQDIQRALTDYPDARALLFDAYHEQAYGGTGQSFDWSWLPAKLPIPWILSGGLHPDNVAQAIAQTHANAVDVSSGVESAHGIKCPHKLAAFIQQAKQAT